jgi:hypothetical protein
MSSLKYVFTGSAVGAAAQFHRLDEVWNLNHVIPALGAGALPVTGGLCLAHVPPYRYEVQEPRPRVLLSVERIDSRVEGKEVDGRYETEVDLDVESIAIVEKLRIDMVRLHVLSVRNPKAEFGEVSTKGNRIEGVRLGNVEAKITLDEEPLSCSGSMAQLASFYRRQGPAYRERYAWRFGTEAKSEEPALVAGSYVYSLVQKIELSGPQEELDNMSVEGYTIVWKGFGRIILGEVHVNDHKRRVTLVRLAMGSDAGGDGTVGDGQSNGQVGG